MAASTSRRSLTGARIETGICASVVASSSRRSLTGARIETASSTRRSACRPVAPSRERGSKHNFQEDEDALDGSLPHGSADRNNRLGQVCDGRTVSLPHGSADRNTTTGQASPAIPVAPSRERGSKHRLPGAHVGFRGRSLTGARIETIRAHCCIRDIASLPHGSADRNMQVAATSGWLRRRSLTGARIET